MSKSVTATFRKKKLEEEEDEAEDLESDASFQINSSEDPLIKWRDKKMEFTLKWWKPICTVVKNIWWFFLITLFTYLLIRISIYFERASLQQESIEQNYHNFELDAKLQFKQFNEHHKNMQEELENVNYVKDEYLKRLKNLFSFAENDMFNGDTDEVTNRCDLIPLNLRFDCHPESGADELACSNRGCCWNPLHNMGHGKQVPLDVPYCYYSKNWRLYKYMNFSKDGNDFSGMLKLERNSFYKNDLQTLQMDAMSMDDSILRIKIFDPNNKRYEPPIPGNREFKPFLNKVENTQYNLSIDENVPGFKIMRASDKRIL